MIMRSLSKESPPAKKISMIPKAFYLFLVFSLLCACFFPQAVFAFDFGLNISFNLTCPSSCTVSQSCNCEVSGCSNGLFIIRNTQGQPINMTLMIMSGDFPLTFFSSSPYTRAFTPTSSGTVSVSALCLETGKFQAQAAQITCITNCSNECNTENEIRCSGNGFQTCGSYDSDSCLEWSGVTACVLDQICQNGSCQGVFENWPAGKSPREIGKRVAENFVRRNVTSVWYQVACTWYGSLNIAKLTGDKSLQTRLIGKFGPLKSKFDPLPANVDSHVLGIVPLELYIQTRNNSYLGLGKSFADNQWAHTTSDGITTEARYWIDDMYMIPALQVQSFRATGDQKYLDRAANTMVAYIDTLQQPNGLFWHEKTNAHYFWGRGNGWVAAGMTELLFYLPETHPQRAKIMAAYKKMMAALLQTQDTNGMWHQLVNHSEAWPETSCSGMFEFALVTGVKNGWLDAPTYGPAARKGWLALANYMDQNADVKEVCIGTNAWTPGQGDPVQYYLNRSRAVGDLHGQAAVSWAAFSLISDQTIIISGRVTNDKGIPIGGLTINLCRPGNVTTDSNGYWSKRVAVESFFCTRIVAGLPSGPTKIIARSNNQCHLNATSYEWQVAGKNQFVGCSSANQSSWDIASDSNLDFVVTILPKPNLAACNASLECQSGFCSNTICCSSGQCGWPAEGSVPAQCFNEGGTRSNKWLSGICRSGQWKTAFNGWGCGNPKWPCDNGTCICENASGCRWEQYFCRSGGSVNATIRICEAVRSLRGTERDASPAIQKCINDAPIGSIVEIPAGKYYVDMQITLQKAITLRTQGKTQSMPRCGYGETHDCAELIAARNKSWGFVLVAGGSGMSVDHIVLNGNKMARLATQAGTECKTWKARHHLSGAGCSNCNFTNNVFKNALCGTAFGIHINNDRIIVSNNTFAYNGMHNVDGLFADGITLKDCTNSAIENNEFIDGGTDIDFVLGGCRNCKIKGNKITKTGSIQGGSFAALQVSAFSAEGGTPATSGDYTGTEISDNVIDCSPIRRCGFGVLLGVDSWGSFMNPFGGSVHDNRITNAQQGLAIDDVHDMKVYNNPVTSSGGREEKCSSGYRMTSRYSIGTRSKNIDTSKDTLGTRYDNINWDRCIPNYWK